MTNNIVCETSAAGALSVGALGSYFPHHMSAESAKLTGLFEYWRSKCAGGSMPSRADLDPTEMPAYLPEIFIAEIHRPLRFRFRLVGTRICERWREDYTGKWLDELDLGAEREAARGQYESAARSGEPRCDFVEFSSKENRYLRYWRLLLPLSDDGRTPNMILGMQLAADGLQNLEGHVRWI